MTFPESVLFYFTETSHGEQTWIKKHYAKNNILLLILITLALAFALVGALVLWVSLLIVFA